MVYKKIEGEAGPYINDDGSYFDILESTKVVSPQGINVGWDYFNNIEEAALAYGLTRVPEPEPVVEDEEIIEEEVNNQDEEC